MKDLLKELEELGISAAGRKIRTDKGQTHNYAKKTRAPRADKGIPRGTYNTDSAAYPKKIFGTYIRSHTNEHTGEDDLFRDQNLIFPPNITRFYKKVTKDGLAYRSSIRRKNHPEQLRWNWYMAELTHAKSEADRTLWKKRISLWYFILPEEIHLWTYDEWAFAYVKAIAGHENRVSPRYLRYDDFARGKWGRIVYDEEGNVVWTS